MDIALLQIGALDIKLFCLKLFKTKKKVTLDEYCFLSMSGGAILYSPQEDSHMTTA